MCMYMMLLTDFTYQLRNKTILVLQVDWPSPVVVKNVVSI